MSIDSSLSLTELPGEGSGEGSSPPGGGEGGGFPGTTASPNFAFGANQFWLRHPPVQPVFPMPPWRCARRSREPAMFQNEHRAEARRKFWPNAALAYRSLRNHHIVASGGGGVAPQGLQMSPKWVPKWLQAGAENVAKCLRRPGGSPRVYNDLKMTPQNDPKCTPMDPK